MPGFSRAATDPNPEREPGGGVQHQKRRRSAEQFNAAPYWRNQPQNSERITGGLDQEKNLIHFIRKKNTRYSHAEQSPRHNQAQEFVRDPLPPDAIAPRK